MWDLNKPSEYAHARHLLESGRIKSPELQELIDAHEQGGKRTTKTKEVPLEARFKALTKGNSRLEKEAKPGPAAYVVAVVLLVLKWLFTILLWGPFFPIAFIIKAFTHETKR